MLFLLLQFLTSLLKQDEVICLPPAVLHKDKPAPKPVQTSMTLKNLKEGDCTLDEPQEKVAPATVVSLTPPQALFQPMEYPPLHIFVSFSGLIASLKVVKR